MPWLREDLYVRPETRGCGHGKAPLAAPAAIYLERGYERFEWSVLDWNEPPIGSTVRSARGLWATGPFSGSPRSGREPWPAWWARPRWREG